MPQTTPASNAFPSSSNSSTLSESALSMFDKPSRSPDSNPETSGERSSESRGMSLSRLGLFAALARLILAVAIPVLALAIFFGALTLRAFTGFAFAGDFFRATGFFETDFFAFAGAFFLAAVFLATVLPGTDFFFADCFRARLSGFPALLFFAAIEFFLVFFLVAIGAV
jgi:hypothetical protein